MIATFLKVLFAGLLALLVLLSMLTLFGAWGMWVWLLLLAVFLFIPRRR
jgi:1,4-dihydroxy-2-naphthoate octaprenyltransferase